VSCGGPGSEVSPIYDILAVRDGKLYSLRQLNRLLLDAGFPFDSASAPTAAKIAVLFSLLGDQFTYTLTPRPQFDWRKYRVPDIDSAQAFPAVEFRRVEWDTALWTDKAGVKRRTLEVLVECDVDGKATEMRIGFRGYRGMFQLRIFRSIRFDAADPPPDDEKRQGLQDR